MSVVFLNISSDRIQCIANGKESILPHGDIEQTVADLLYGESLKGANKVLILNGPGSFTHLRIGTLALNMYNFLNQNSLELYTIDKLALYQKLYHRNILPQVGYIYIGQRKNWRKVNLETLSHETVQELTDKDAFIDQLFEGEAAENMIRLGWKDDELHIAYKGAEHTLSFAELELEPVKTLEANYMMDANVTIKEY